MLAMDAKGEATAGGPVVETEVEYGLVERATGLRVCVSRQANVGDCCGEYRVAFERPGHGCLPYAAPTPEAVSRALVEDTHWYNSSDEYPGWGPYKPADLEMVRVDTVRTVTRVPLPVREAPLVLSDYAMDVRRNIVAEVDPDLATLLPNGLYRFQVVRPNEAAPDLASLAGKLVDFDKYGTWRFRAVAVLPVPERLADVVRGPGEAALLVCLQNDGPSPIEPYCTLGTSPSPRP